jgi:hypothetical protein
MVLTAIGLWFAWKISEHYLDGDKRVLGLALLTLVPLYNFHALKFNANAVMIPVWAAATYWFLRSFETRSILYAALAGFAAAAAMLGKYWSIVLLIGLAVAALADPRRREYFRSAAPWVTIAVGALALTPHVVWLAARDFEAFGYATGSHPVGNYGEAALSGLGYVAGSLGYVALPIVLALAVARPGRAALADMLWPRDASRRTALIAFAVPILLPAALAVVAKSEVVSIWAMAAMTLLPVVLLSSPLLAVPRAAVVHVVALAVAAPVLLAVLSPAIAAIIHQRGVPKGQAHFQLLAGEMTRSWRAATDQPLRFVGGDPVLAHGVLFYLPDRPLAYTADRSLSPIDPARVARDGIAMACVTGDRGCEQLIAPLASDARARRSEVGLSRSYLGIAGPPVRYVIVVVPPLP